MVWASGSSRVRSRIAANERGLILPIILVDGLLVGAGVRVRPDDLCKLALSPWALHRTGILLEVVVVVFDVVNAIPAEPVCNFFISMTQNGYNINGFLCHIDHNRETFFTKRLVCSSSRELRKLV